VYLVSTGGVALLFEAEDPLDLVDRMEPATDGSVAGGESPKAAWYDSDERLGTVQG
jgi:hypothetical protein